VGVPIPEARGQILRARLRGLRHGLSPGEVSELAAAAHGFVSADLAALCEEAAMAALRRVVGAAGREAGRRREEGGGGGDGGRRRAGGAAPQGGGGGGGGGEAQRLVVGLGDFRVAETRVRPSAMREVAVEVPRVGPPAAAALAPAVPAAPCSGCLAGRPARELCMAALLAPCLQPRLLPPAPAPPPLSVPVLGIRA
jgi:hypothetical protein